MKIPQYLFDRLDLIRSPKKAGRALRHYSKRLDQMGILPGTKLFHYFREGRFFFCPCDLDFAVNLRGDCSITFVFSMHRDPHGSSLGDLVRVRVCFQGVKDIQCTLNECSESGSSAVASKTVRHTVADRITAIEAKKPQLKQVAKSARLGKGTGHYFNGVGRIGLTRPFVFNETTRVHKGESNYYQSDQSIGHKNTTGTRNMTRIPEVQLFTAGNPTPVRLCAHDDETLIDVFVKLLREAIRSH